jgi:hypothetical protein
LTVERATYAFAAVFPIFAADRLARRAREKWRGRTAKAPVDVVSLPKVSPGAERVLMGLSSIDKLVLGSRNLPFGSSVLVAARKPVAGGPS